MTKIDIFSGFLGSGKTTLIKKLISEAYAGEKLVLIENEFGEIGIDGGFLAEAGIQINEMNSGCICCSLVGDFAKALRQVLTEYKPDRILIEPSGVGKLSDVIRAVKFAAADGATLNGFTTVVDAGKAKMYMKNFGEFFNDQVENAGCIIISHADVAPQKKVEEAVALLREHNQTAVIVSTPWMQLTGAQLLEAMERRDTLEAELARLAAAADDDDDEDEHEHHHHHHHDDDEDEHEHEHHHHHHDDDDDEDEHEHHHHHHEDGEECDDPECECHHHHHHHHHHHDADEVFVSCGAETAVRFDRDELAGKLAALTDEQKYGIVLRAKGIVAPADGGAWIHFDYVPGEPDVRTGAAAVIGRLCVIGSKLNVEALSELFGVALKLSEDDD
ncbi:MAG: GTP-binding protein [Clostridia bacterium]|nr:GTP-binding protein [Clostridia bacterium]